MEEAERIVSRMSSRTADPWALRNELLTEPSWNRWECRAAVAKHPALPATRTRWLIHRIALDRSVGVRRSIAKRTDLLPYQRVLLEWEGKCNPALRCILEDSYWLFDEEYSPEKRASDLYKFIATGKSARSTWTWLLSEKSDPWLRGHLVDELKLFDQLSQSTRDHLSRDSSPWVRVEFLRGMGERDEEHAWWPKERRYEISLEGFAEVIGDSFFPDDLPDIYGFGDSDDPPEQEDIRRCAMETGWKGTLGELINLYTTGSLGGGSASGGS